MVRGTIDLASSRAARPDAKTQGSPGAQRRDPDTLAREPIASLPAGKKAEAPEHKDILKDLTRTLQLIYFLTVRPPFPAIL